MLRFGGAKYSLLFERHIKMQVSKYEKPSNIGQMCVKDLKELKNPTQSMKVHIYNIHCTNTPPKILLLKTLSDIILHYVIAWVLYSAATKRL